MVKVTFWEYAVKWFEDDEDVQTELRKYGMHGWELVSVCNDSWIDERKGYKHSGATFYFKRPLPGKPHG